MVDGILPSMNRRLEVLFLDFNSFFASVEQQERPELRGKPVIVVPVDADTTCAIAASYEAKKLGVKTLTQVGEAKRIIPGLHVVQARPRVYKAYHEAIREVAQGILPESKVHSIDEMSYRLLGEERIPERAKELALNMKAIIRSRIGACMTCSIGIAPNVFLAKMATELQKPDGLVLLEAADLPGPLLNLKLRDFCGINRGMEKRLHAAMVFTTEQLYSLDSRELRLAFGSVIGEKWWYLLRGYDLPEEEPSRKSLSHSHVLAPELRTDEGAKQVLVRLIQKAAARLRSEGLFATSVSFGVSGFGRSWHSEARLPGIQDSATFVAQFDQDWPSRKFDKPRKVSVVFGGLKRPEEVTPSLFDDSGAQLRMSRAVDVVNNSFGKNSVYIAGSDKAKTSADEKIAFNKTWLFSEGKGDNDWVDTFRGLVSKEGA